jgi:hypothetical protein
MPRLLTVLLAFLLLGVGLPLSTTAAAEEAISSTASAEAVAEKPEMPPPAAEASAEEVDKGTGAAPAEEPAPAEEAEAAEEPEAPGAVDEYHRKISSGVLATSRWLDSFFADPRVENEAGESRVRVRFSLFAEEGSAIEYDVRANVRLDLPVLKNRLQLLFAGDPEDDDDFRAITGGEGVPPQLADTDENASVSLRYFLQRTVYRHMSLRGGVRFRNGLPVLFLEPRYRQSVPFDHWLFRFTQRVIGLTDGTVRARTTFDLERELRRKLFLRLTADGTWDKDEHGYFYTLGPSIFQPLSPRRVLVYSWGNSFVTHPSHRLESVVLSVRYRQRIWRDWLYYEVAPQLSFPREENFDITPGIFLRLEMLFGHYPKLPPEPEDKKSARK